MRPSRVVTAAITLSLVALVSCGGGSPAENTTPSSRVAPAVAQLDKLAADILARSGIPGMAVAVVHKGKIVYAKGFGVRELGLPTPIDANTVFQLASVSKPVGAMVVATQVGKKRVSWESPVTQYLPWFALYNPQATLQVTVGDFYSHQSGLPDHGGDDLEELGYSRRQVLERLRYLPSKPLRTQYAYTNIGLTAGAEAVAVAAGTSWEQLSEQEIYRPLGMSSTSSVYADFISRTNRASPHIRINGHFEPGPIRQPDVQTPAGGVSSSVLDMANWMTLVLNEGMYQGTRLIPKEALLPAISPQVTTSPASDDSPAGHYGYGFNISTTAAGHKLLGHSGAFTMGAATSFNLLPAADTGIVVLTNALPVGAAEALCLTYMDLVQFGHSSRDWLSFLEPYFADMVAPTGEFAGQPFPANPAPALPLSAYLGTYANDYYGDAHVQERNGELVMTMGPAKQEFLLQHWDGNIFVFEPVGEIAPPGSRSAVTFTAGPGGAVQSLAIELYEETGVGTLARR